LYEGGYVFSAYNEFGIDRPSGGATLYAVEVSRFEISELSTGTGSIGAVPEPATWLMLLAGFGAIGWVARKRRAKSCVSYI